MTKITSEEHLASVEPLQVVEPDLVAGNVGIENEPSETKKDPLEKEKEHSEAEKVCSDATGKKLSETMEVEIDPKTDESDDHKIEQLVNIKGLKLIELLHRDQLDGMKGLADMQIVCQDGEVPVHRYILMAASSWINVILLKEDPSELAVIHIPDEKVVNVVEVLRILYSGIVVYPKPHEGPIYSIFKMLGVDTHHLQFRNAKPEDVMISRRLRFYEKEPESKEEEFIPNILQRDSPEIPMVEAQGENDFGEDLVEENIVQNDQIEVTPEPRSTSQIDKAGSKRKGRKRRQKDYWYPWKKRAPKRKPKIRNVDVQKLSDQGEKAQDVNDDVIFEEVTPPNSKKSLCEPSSSSAASSSLERDSLEIPTVEAHGENDVGAELMEENIVQYDEIEKTRGLRAVSKSQIETAKLKSVDKEMAKGENATLQTDYKIKCRYCQLVYTSEQKLSEHLSSSCGSHLLGKYSYAKKQCLGCCRRFPSYNLYGLINHVESCKRLEVAFSATASQFVNGNLPPVSLKEGSLDQLDEMGNEMYPHGSNSGAKGKKGASTGGEPKRRGMKPRQKSRGKKSAAKRKGLIKIVDVSTLTEKEDEGHQTDGSDQQLEMPVLEHEGRNKKGDVDDDVIFEKEVIHPPYSKKPRFEPSSSSAAGSSEMMMHSGKPVGNKSLGNQEENETFSRGLPNQIVPQNTYMAGNARNHEQNMNNGEIEEIVIIEDSDECQNISSIGDNPDTDVEFISNGGKQRKGEQRQPKTRHSQTDNQRLANIPATSDSAPNPPQINPPQPVLGRVLLEIKDIGGEIYNIYGLVNPTSVDPKKRFSKVIAIKNTNVHARANMEKMKKQ